MDEDNINPVYAAISFMAKTPGLTLTEAFNNVMRWKKFVGKRNYDFTSLCYDEFKMILQQEMVEQPEQKDEEVNIEINDGHITILPPQRYVYEGRMEQVTSGQ